MPTIYVVNNDMGQSISFHATRKDAEAAKTWWRSDKGGLEVEIKPVEYRATRKGIAALLNRFGVEVW